MNKNRIIMAVIGLIIGIVAGVIISNATINKAHASVSYPNPATISCPVNITDNQKFNISFLVYRWHIVSQTTTSVTYKLQLDINPTPAENWQDVGQTRVVAIPVCTQPVVFTGVSDGASTHPDYHPASCGGIYADKPVAWGERVSPTVIATHWGKVANADKYSLVFGYVKESIGMGAHSINQEATGLQIPYLHSNQSVQFQIWAWKGQCVTMSNTIIVK